MFYIKSDDIEELFREAAEKYQIDTTAAEAWNDVEAAVHADDVPPPQPDARKKRRWFVLGWLLLIPLGWFANNTWMALHSTKNKDATQQFATAVAPKEKGKSVAARQDIKKIGDNKQTAVATTPADVKSNQNEKLPTAVTGGMANRHGSGFMRTKQPHAAGNNFNASTGSNPQGAGRLSHNVHGAGPAETTAGIKNSQPSAAEINSGGVNPGLDKGKDITANQAEKVSVKAPPLTLDSQPPNQTPTSEKGDSNSTVDKSRRDNKKRSKDEHYFYAGLSVAPDVSFIRFQKASTLGKGIGITLGYHINKNISIETGALIEKKYYYTNGEYFDITKIPYFVANNIHPEDASGNCNMIEVPLNLRYTFKTKRNNSFYAIGGISSYLMGHEEYTFDYKDWGIQKKSTWGYHNASDYWFSILNLGMGYDRKLGNKTDVRLEPYMKLPLSGLGTGNLKIASTGIYFTLTRRIP